VLAIPTSETPKVQRLRPDLVASVQKALLFRPLIGIAGTSPAMTVWEARFLSSSRTDAVDELAGAAGKRGGLPAEVGGGGQHLIGAAP
jgi:hypothetical protein